MTTTPIARKLAHTRKRATSHDVNGSLKTSRRAYSYKRFSSAAQAEGGSLTRQTAWAQAYCERKKLTLDETLTLNDLGVSAFRGDNVKDGALAGFLEACRLGRVPRGSVLIVESLDRLSRDQIRPALQLLFALQDFGITIVTLQPEREYPPDNHDALALIEPLIVFARAHEESAMKSHRRRDGWKQARDRARQGRGPMLKTCPAWLRVTPEGFRIKEKAAAAVRQIYELARDGMGVYRITERLNAELVPPIGNGSRWVKAYVYRILTNPAAMGTYQPHKQDGKTVVPDGEPIPKHYPAVVTEKVWHEAQAAIQRRSGGRDAGRKGAEETNLFSGLLTCALTGERLHIINALGRKGDGERKRYKYLTPSKEAGSPAGKRIDYAVFERAVLSLLLELKPSDVADDAKPANGRQAEIAKLSGQLLDLDSKLERTRQRARTAGDFDAFLDLIADLQIERKQVSERRAELEHQEDGRATADLGEAHSLIALLDKARPEQRGELRRRLKTRIRQLVETAPVVIVRRGRTCLCVVQLWFRARDRRRTYIIIHKPGTRYGEGQSWATSYERRKLDLRDADEAKTIASELEAIDLEKFEAGKWPASVKEIG
jgi:DNA invertase Pin-like site-specific DNA recombinase